RCVEIQQPTYLLRFHYPTEEEKARRKRAAQQERALNMMVKFGLSKETAKLNYLYYGKGDKAIAPSAIWDDGRFTYIQYADNRDLPAVYKINPDGSEMLVNSHMEEDVIVVHETAPKLIIRLGESVLGVENKGYKTGSYNRLKTNQPDAVRINKGVE
ncbi:MAG: TrbG/VirB9 family P-type conjugative transfer protein, partial [Neisseriaceae bacterium]|nr:TrbG/VirB9 family P-type conjugative transfer protein [Neisseriaceae bacterium]